jgi:hypothetical protein
VSDKAETEWTVGNGAITFAPIIKQPIDSTCDQKDALSVHELLTYPRPVVQNSASRWICHGGSRNSIPLNPATADRKGPSHEGAVTQPAAGM